MWLYLYLLYRSWLSAKLQQAVRELYQPTNQAPTKLQQVVGEFDETKLQQPVAEMKNEKLYQVGGEFPLPFALVPWGHHIAIITKCETIDKALFYIGKTIEQGLSRDANNVHFPLLMQDNNAKYSINPPQVRLDFK